MVGRTLELEAIESAVDSALESLVGILLEGEPGIGKTTLVRVAADLAAARGMSSVYVVTDEEIRGPLLIARAIFDNDELRADMSPETGALIDRARKALRGEDDASMASMPADERLLRAFDICASAMLAIAREKPMALLLDDFQWADQDSIRLLRYVIRASASARIYLMLTIRPEEAAQVTEIVNLLADLERLGILRRLRVERLHQNETAQMLRSILGGEPSPTTAATIHAQSEGVPFIIVELTRTYREAGLLQPIGGTWSLGRHAERLMPSAVRTLIQRRSAPLPPETREILATGAVLGRAFRIGDVCALRTRRGETTACQPEHAFDLLRPALAAGLISEVGEDANRHMAFAHEQVRTFALEALSSAQRQSMHAAIVELLTADGDPTPEALPVVVRHALAAGDSELIGRYSRDAARAALAANAPEEALRVVDEALGSVSHPAQRVELLCIRDDALLALGRTTERLEAITELSALVEATGDKEAEYDVQLRRVAALRGDKRYEAAADAGRRIRSRAAADGDRNAELRACFELGQALLRTSLGEGYAPTPSESDLDGAEEAFERARVIAEEAGSDARLAQALRELGVIGVARVRAWFMGLAERGEHLPYLVRIANGETIQDIERELPIHDQSLEAERQLTTALELFEKVGDRRGAMSAIVALAYLNWGTDLHVGANPAQRFEGIRQLATAVATLVQGSARQDAEGQMLYGAHVFARAKVIPDLALERGEEAYKSARASGDGALEFLSAIGLTHVHLELDDVDDAQRWLDRAASCAAISPTPHRARRVAAAAALIAGARGETAAMVAGLREVATMAANQRRPAAQAETLAQLAIEAARLGAASGDAELLDAATDAASEARRLADQLPGQPPWSAQADAAEARVAMVRGDGATALEHGRKAFAYLMGARRDDPHLEILMPAARAVLAHGTEQEQHMIGSMLQFYEAFGAARMMDEQIRMRWFRGPIGRELVELAGPAKEPAANAPSPSQHAELDESQGRLLRMLVQGRSNKEIAEEMGLDEAGVNGVLSTLYARIGTSSRAETTAFAFRTV